MISSHTISVASDKDGAFYTTRHASMPSTLSQAGLRQLSKSYTEEDRTCCSDRGAIAVACSAQAFVHKRLPFVLYHAKLPVQL